jgi:hypothetical protein
MLTERLSRAEYLAQLRSSEFARNSAVQKHIAKLEVMSDESWVEHRANLLALHATAHFKRTVKRLASEVK